MPYHHHVNTHHRAKRARKLKKISTFFVALFALVGVGIFGDWLYGQLKTDTVVSRSSNATVQSARINIFQTPYFRFQANESWREVTDELNLNPSDGSKQYLYRKFDRNFIEHELWITVNLPEGYKLERHNVPTRVLPVRLESDGTLTQIGSVSEPCIRALPLEEQKNETPRIIKQEDISYFCNPNNVNDYHVAVGIPGGTNSIPSPSGAEVTITYRNVTPTPNGIELENLLSTFKVL